ncbi:MAG: type II toxin-antitoxin system RelE/ParE family toxin [Acidobacteria bacterium]|nr:type II toxin-antitoxin system RelE/ParE family toxin [Acidobacteriota bacterium]
MKQSFILAPAARQDLIEIWEFIAQESVDAADRVREDIYDAIIKLTRMPRMGHLREHLMEEPLRFWNVRSYLILSSAGRKPSHSKWPGS